MYESFFEINTEILKNSNKDDVIIDKFYPIENTKDGHHTFRCESKGKKIYINSKYDINNEVDMLLSNVDFDKDSLFIVYGIGLGYHIKEIIKRSSHKSKIFVIESDMKILNTYLRNENLLDICNDKVFLFFGSEQSIIAEINSHVFSFSIMPLSVNCIPVIMTSYHSIYGEWVENVNKRIMDLFKHALFNLGNDIGDTIIGLKNNFKNIKELIKSPNVEIVKDKYKDLPAIIVSAGPSLDKNIQELKNASGKALILAVDAVISTLKKNNIVPDAVFSIERGIETYDAFYKNNVIDEEIVFIGPPVVATEILDKLKLNKKLLFLKQGEKINEWINEDILRENRLLHMGTSCAHIAFAFAKYVNASPIIFVGQDLAYTKEGVTHSDYVEIKAKVEANKNALHVKGINGEMLPTSYAFKNFLVFLESEIAKDNSSRLYIDATEGGAFKHGTKIMKLREVILEYCNISTIKLNNLVPSSNTLDINKYKSAINELNELARKFNNLKVDCEKLLKTFTKLEKDIISSDVNLKEVFKKLKKKEEIEQIIFKEDVIRTFLQSILMAANIKETSLENKESYDIAVEKINIYKNLMGYLIIGCDATYKAINDMIDNSANNLGERG
ncbi:motility associated factor glycosyltransferase family protein [Clostridium sp.]